MNPKIIEKDWMCFTSCKSLDNRIFSQSLYVWIPVMCKTWFRWHVLRMIRATCSINWLQSTGLQVATQPLIPRWYSRYLLYINRLLQITSSRQKFMLLFPDGYVSFSWKCFMEVFSW